VRGIRLHADGIPATMPDGQGQVSHFSMISGGRVEVLRGPFSALYGNSSGGVVQWWSAEPTALPELTVQSSLGRDRSRTLGARLLGSADAMGYHVAMQRFLADGYRDHSAAERSQLHAKLGFELGDGRLEVVANRLQASALDPLGLTWAQVQEDPTQAVANAHLFDTRKTVDQDQLGLLVSQPAGEGGTLRASAWAGEREVEQYLAIPAGAQANPLSSGGVIDLDNRFGGADLRWSWQGALAGRPAELHVGANVEGQKQRRRGYENFDGATLGVRGILRRDEDNEVRGVDQYAQAWWRFAPKWSLLAGMRRSGLRFESRDRYVTDGNPDDSGEVRYSQTTPVAGLVYAAGENLNLHLSAGRGFETPTFNELGYRADGGAGLAFDLRPAVSHNLELGGKWRNRRGAQIQWALFRSDTDDELAVARNVGGRSSYRNVGASRRTGVELSVELPLSDRWVLEASYTGLDATFRDAFPICAGAGCATPDVMVAAGTRIPGVAQQQLRAALQWRYGDWWAAVEGVGTGDVTVNDPGDRSAPGHFLLHLALGREWALGAHRLEAFLRADNVLDQAYIGSVIVNEGNGRYYEPGPRRGLLMGLRWQWGGP
jgi:iron complex outermembrane receptor protein